MKYKLLLPLLFILATSANAEIMAQGGDIAAGAKFKLETLDMISYYKDGKSGAVIFKCFLEGRGVRATLSPGKNFNGNSYDYMKTGENGPYMWTLRDHGYNTGNIRVRMLKGKNVTVQCKQIA